MKTNVIIILTLICQSLCAQLGPQISEWAHQGFSEMKVYEPDGSLYYWSQLRLTPSCLTETLLFTAATTDYDRLLQQTQYWGSRQQWWASNRTSISWSENTVITNITPWSGNGRWDTGGSCSAWKGTGIDGRPYDLQYWADMAVLWYTNTDTFWFRCQDHSAEEAYVLGLFRTNGTTSLTGLSDCKVKPGQTNLLRAPEADGLYQWKYMLQQACRSCGESCTLAWTMTGKARGVRVALLADSGAVAIEFPSHPRLARWKLEKSSDGTAWEEAKSGTVTLQDRLDGATVRVSCPAPATLTFYRVQFANNTPQDSLSEMFDAGNNL